MHSLSIIIPTCRANKIVQETLESIKRESSLENTEVIFVENGPKNESFCNIVENIGFRYFHEPTEGLLAGRHLGTLKSQGDILVFLDDDVVLYDGWIRGVKEAFSDESVHLATGPNKPRYCDEIPEWLDQFWIDLNNGGKALYQLSLLDLGLDIKNICPTLVWGLNFGIRKNTLLELGGFHPDGVAWEQRRFRGDGESGVAHKANLKKLKAVYHPKMAVDHIVPKSRLTMEYFEKRAFLQGISDSYTDKRKSVGLYSPIQDEGPETSVHQLAQPKGFAHRLAAKFRHLRIALIKPRKNSKVPSTAVQETPEIIKIAQMHKRGYDFHCQQMQEDPTLVEWVLKPDYWDYSYPSAVFNN